MASEATIPRRRAPPLGARGQVLLLLVVAAAWATVELGLTPADLVPGEGGRSLAAEFFARALRPALHSEARYLPEDAPPLLVNAALAAGRTVLFAAAAMSLALVLGLLLGFCGSSAWWSEDPIAGDRRRSLPRRLLLPMLWFAARALSTVLRSIHELLWALLFLLAVGLGDAGAVLAIALPYTGILAKVFSEMIDEAPRDAAHALRAAGAGALQVFGVGLLPRAMPDLVAYSFYRFECALRSSAILGFFGYETLGLYIRQSMQSTNYGEVWTYLYVLIAMIALFDLWSGAIRRRLVQT